MLSIHVLEEIAPIVASCRESDFFGYYIGLYVFQDKNGIFYDFYTFYRSKEGFFYAINKQKSKVICKRRTVKGMMSAIKKFMSEVK